MLGSMDPPSAEKELKDLGTKARKSKPERSPNCLCCAGDQPEKRMKISSSEDTDVNTETRLKALVSTDLYESSEGENGPADGDDKLTFLQSVLNYRNPFCTKELEDSVLKMCQEMEKSNPDLEMLKKSMRMSFPYRKHEYQRTADVFSTLEVFPVLRDFRFLKGDLKLLLKVRWAALDEKLEERMSTEYDNFNRGNTGGLDPVIDSAKEQLELQRWNEELLRDIQLLCLGFKKSKGKLYRSLYSQRKKNEQPFKSPSNTPTIDIKGPLGSEETRIAVYCEGQHITSTPNFYEAVMCAYSIHWLFNLVYEKNCKKFFEYFDWLIGE